MQHQASDSSCECSVGEKIYLAGSAGGAWVLLQGSVRLDRAGCDDETGFAGIAVKGDILGAEVLLFGGYTYTATALTRCVVAPWPGDARLPGPVELLGALTRAERRAADAIALRCGTAASRVSRLVALMTASLPVRTISRIMLPALRDMAEITGLTIGTVSRVLATMQAEGLIDAASSRRGRPPVRLL